MIFGARPAHIPSRDATHRDVLLIIAEVMLTDLAAVVIRAVVPVRHATQAPVVTMIAPAHAPIHLTAATTTGADYCA